MNGLLFNIALIWIIFISVAPIAIAFIGTLSLFLIFTVNFIWKMIIKSYNFIINIPTIWFIEKIPNNSYITYENGDFFVRCLNFNHYTEHEKLAITEKFRLEDAITEEIPFMIRTNLIRLSKKYSKINIVKKNNYLFITKHLEWYEGLTNNYCMYLNSPFESTKNIKTWFKAFN